MLPTKWPRWIIIPIGFALAAALTGLGFGLVLAAQAAMPTVAAVPSPTPPVIEYAADLSAACTTCHLDQARLGQTAVAEEEIQRLYIEPASIQVLHGRLGCVTCHKGTPDTENVEAAHTGIVVDPSIDLMADCLVCHRDLSNEYPEDLLIAPHEQVVSGSAQDLACSDCHGSVGHGYDPVTGEVIISMSACLDCHEERQLAVQREDCEACHTKTPPWSPEAACDTCHSLDSYTYEESRENPDLLAYAHAQEGLVCLDCHEQAALEESHEGAAPGAAVEQRTYDSEFCTGCHLENEHTSEEEVAARTVELEYNPHESHLIGKLECGACHKNHRQSREQCTECHDPVATGAGWTTGTSSSAELGLLMFEPDMDCTACKSMVPYVESLENSALSAYTHAREGLVCLDCHAVEETKQVHEEAVPGRRVKALKIEDEFCLGCHVENEHSSYEQVIERTKDYILGEQNINPHDPHADTAEVAQKECYTCHKMHKQSPLLNGCYGCHHSRTFASCDTCHRE